ncbi:MAG TPA: YdeI/OmpD-associated family protein [Pseudonocardiaceae bacterium]|nr:YdeI/OmpD-associated family protein [Pseudonocardiaceae bacterium]
MRFHATIELNGKTATGIEVPPEVVTELGGGKRAKVTVTINGFTYRNSIASMGGRFLISVSADVRAQAGVAAGDQVDVDVELDTAPREVTVPDDLAAALARDAKARGAFEKLTYSHRLRWVSWINDAKKAETRDRRVVTAIEDLRAE